MTRDTPFETLASPRETAASLALVLGGLGAHKFYLGRRLQGLLCVLFFWSFIPSVLGAAEGLYYLALTDEAFDRLVARRRSIIGEALRDAMTVLAVMAAPRNVFTLAGRQAGYRRTFS